MLRHKDKRRVSAWLKTLRENQLLDWFYEPTNPTAASKPAVYFLGKNGIRYLKRLGYPYRQLRNRQADAARRPDFIARCLLLADCCMHLESRIKDGIPYRYALEADYTAAGSYCRIAENERIHPGLVFTKNRQPDGLSQTYYLELFDDSAPRYMIKKKAKDYIGYLAEHTTKPPIVLLAFASIADLAYAKRYIRKQTDELWDDALQERIRVSTIDKLRTKGLTAVIWEDI